MGKKLFFAPLLVLFIPFFSSPAHAATTGKVAGKVVDAQTGDPLPGANIIITGTNYGAAADINGAYFIINVPPGRYDLEARMMGYGAVKMEAVHVRTNATTTADFKLSTQVIEGETIVVTVDAISVKKDQTSSIRNVSSDQIDMLPVESVQQVLSLQAGVVNGHFRGGRTNEVSYMIDGLQVNDPYNKGRLTDVETEVIQDVEVILGTFNAEYGRAMSGIVNAVTKEGGKQLHGMVSGQFGNYYTNHTDIFIGLDPGDVLRKKNLRLQLQGPIIKKYLTYFINYRTRDEANHLNGIYRFNPDDYSNFTSVNPDDWYSEHTGDNSYIPMSTFNGYSLYSKLTLRPTLGLKANFIYNRSNGERGAYSHYMKYNPTGVAHSYSDVSTYTLLLNHTISKKIFHEFKVNYVDNLDRYFLYEDPLDPRYVSDWYGLSAGPGFSTGSQNKTHNTNKTKRLDIKYDLTWQINNNHSIKTGFLVTDYDKDIREYQIVNKYRNASNERERDTLYTAAGDIEKIYYPWYAPEILDDSTTYSNIYRKQPREMSTYIQDKMEFEDFVINIGLRYDRFDPKTIYPSNLRNPGNKLRYDANPERMSTYPEAEIKEQLSPRFGLAYTLSDQAKMHFSYGHFFQMPDAYALYTNHNYIIPESNFATTIGNPQLKPEKSVKYEVGLWQELMPGVGLNVALYYADVYDLLSTSIITTYDDVRYGLYTNKDYGNRKGLEVGIDAQIGSLYGSVNYTLQYTRGNADNPTQTFTRAGNSMDPIARLIPLSWDQRHTLNATFAYQTAKYGATITGIYNSGTTFTWQPLSDSRLSLVNLYPNNAYKPSNFSVDFNGHYDIPLRSNLKIRLSLLVYNLLDAKNEFIVDQTTGRANQSIVRDVDLILHRSDFNTYYDRINNPANLSAPRELKFTVGLYF